MRLILKVSLVLFFVSIGCRSVAQIEVAHLSTKGYSGNGLGAFLTFTIPLSDEGTYLTPEIAFYYVAGNDHNIALVPFLIGYRQMLDKSESGWYVEPAAGYNIGATDIQKTDQFGNGLYNTDGSELDQKVQGISAAFTAGYIVPGSLRFNIGLRYNHIFVSNDPGVNLYSLRFSIPLSFGKRS